MKSTETMHDLPATSIGSALKRMSFSSPARVRVRAS